MAKTKEPAASIGAEPDYCADCETSLFRSSDDVRTGYLRTIEDEASQVITIT